MEILRFLKWWWTTLDTAFKPFVLIITFVIVALIIAVGLPGLLTFLATIVATLIGLLLYMAINAIRKQWKEFRAVRDKEAERLVAILRGRGEE